MKYIYPRDIFSLLKMYIYPSLKRYNTNVNYINRENISYINELGTYLDDKTGNGLLNKVLKHIPEMHLSLPNDVPSENVREGTFNKTGKYSYCGPGTKYRKRLREGYEGVNSLDRACKEHDLAYSKMKSTKQRNIADDILANKASEIALNPNKPDYERKDAKLVTGVMAMKSRFGMGKNLKKCPQKRAL